MDNVPWLFQHSSATQKLCRIEVRCSTVASGICNRTNTLLPFKIKDWTRTDSDFRLTLCLIVHLSKKPMSRGNSPFKKENVCTLGGFWNQEKMTQKRSPEGVCVVSSTRTRRKACEDWSKSSVRRGMGLSNILCWLLICLNPQHGDVCHLCLNISKWASSQHHSMVV